MKRAKVIIDFILPRSCEICKEKLSLDEKIVCLNCLNDINTIDNEFIKTEFERKFANERIIDTFTSAFLFKAEGNLQKLLHQLKYKKKFGVGKYLGKLIVEKQNEFFTRVCPDIIIPVPLHRLKNAERGYNQSYYIAKGIASKLNIPIHEKLVKREKYTESQTKLGINERRQNVTGIFSVKRTSKLKGKNIVIVDDVITTGATISELAKVLKNAGAEKVYAVSVGIADLPTSSREPILQV